MSASLSCPLPLSLLALLLSCGPTLMAWMAWIAWQDDLVFLHLAAAHCVLLCCRLNVARVSQMIGARFAVVPLWQIVPAAVAIVPVVVVFVWVLVGVAAAASAASAASCSLATSLSLRHSTGRLAISSCIALSSASASASPSAVSASAVAAGVVHWLHRRRQLHLIHLCLYCCHLLLAILQELAQLCVLFL